MKYLYPTFLILILMTGCIPKPWIVNDSNTYLDNKYYSMILTDRALTFYPFPDTIINFNYSEDTALQKLYGAENEVDSSMTKKIFKDSLYYYMLNQSYHVITNININKENLDSTIDWNFSDTTKYTKFQKDITVGNGFTYLLPKADYLSSIQLEPDVLILVNKIIVTDSVDFIYNYTNNNLPWVTLPAVGQIQSATPYLLTFVEFIIWDYKADKPIKFGEVIIKTDQEYDWPEGIWQANNKRIIEEIVNDTPFERRSGVRMQ